MKRLLLSLVFVVVALSIAAVTRGTAIGDLAPGSGKTIIDAHMHVAGLGYGDSGCFINEKMRNNFRFRFFLRAMGVTEDELKAGGDRILFDILSRNIADSSTIAKGIVFAMDGYVTAEGELDKGQTQVYVPNDYVLSEASRFDNLLYAASVNPNRVDAIDRLQQAKRDGAVLVKWIPSIMNIDPAAPRHIPFYRKMAELNIPLLSHTGMEKSFDNARDELADPLRLRLPLEHGVTVIAAHIATTGESEGQDNFERILPLFRQYPNLYTDISSLTQINKLGFLAKALQVEGLRERMIYGTDWPLQFFPLISPWYHLNHIGLRNAWRIGGIANQWDRDVALKVAMGVPDEVFGHAEKLLRLER